MATDVLSIVVVAFWALAAAGVTWHLASLAGEVTYVTLADGRRTARSIPLLYRALLPFAPNFDALVSRPALAGAVSAADRTLVSAGFEGLLSGREFVAMRILVPIAVAPFACLSVGLLATLAFGGDGLGAGGWTMAALASVGLAYVQPALWLRGAQKRRHLSIQKALPFVLDLLTLSVEAGMDFISALQRNCKSRRLDPLNEELLRMTKEIQVGSSRKEALRNMAERVRQPDLKAVAFALVQADELGVSIGAILRIQSEQLRSKRFDRAEKLAAEAPVKMLGPLMLCIFPAVFVILLGPVLSQALKGFFG